MSASALQAPTGHDRAAGTAAPGAVARRRALSVRGYLVLLAVTVLLPLLVLAFLLTQRAVEAEQARITQSLAATGGGVLTVVDREVTGLIETLQTLETSPSLTAGDLRAFHQQIRDLGQILGVTIALRDPGGRVLASSHAPWSAGPGPPLRSRHDEALLAQRAIVVTGVYRAPTTEEASFAVMMPVQRDGAVRYLLHLAPPAARLRAVLATLDLAPVFRVAVLDADGRVVARSRGHERAVGEASALQPNPATMSEPAPRAGRGVDLEGREVYFNAQRSQHGWTVVTSLLAEEMDAPRRKALVNAAIAAVLLTGAALLAARLLGTRLAGAIRGLAVAGSALDRGEKLSFAPSGIREIDDVAATLALAGDRLRAAAAQRAEAQERQRLILHELNHRVKNTLAMVQALAALAARGAPDVVTYRDRLTERLNGLARTQALLTDSDWTGAMLEDLLRGELGMYEDAQRTGYRRAGSSAEEGLRRAGASAEEGAPPRITIAGPPVRLRATHVVAFGMLTHELGTNAAKYGALSTQQGRLAVTWAVEPGPDGPMLALRWVESDGPPVTPPERQGFGTQMIGRGLARQLGAEVETEWRREGLRFFLRMPLGSLRMPLGSEPPAPC